jgi:TRAP-type transport system small permease protein
MRVIDRLDRIFITISIICLFAIMVIVALDGLFRQFFDSPIIGAYELVEKYLMAAMVFPAIGYTWAKRGHIGVTLALEKMPKAVQNITHLITILLAVTVMGLIGYTGAEKTILAFTGNHLTSGLIRWPLWLAYIWMPVGSFLFCLRLIAEFIINIIQIYKQGLNNTLIHKVR